MINRELTITLCLIPIIITFLYGFLVGILTAVMIYSTEVFLRYQGLMPKKDITGQHVLITGGGMGIGKELAIQFTKYKCKISILELSGDLCIQVKSDIQKLGHEDVETYICNVTDNDKVDQVFEEAVKRFGDIDILINNAGIVTRQTFLEYNPAAYTNCVQINTIAHFYTIKNVINRMFQRNKGHIVSLCSISGYIPTPGLDYTASKFGVRGIHEGLTLSLESTRSQVQTTCYCPFFINTTMNQNIPDKVMGIKKIQLTDACKRLIQGIRQNENIVVQPFVINILIFLKQFLPHQVFILLFAQNQSGKKQEAKKV